ncbi:hypothetical protein BKA69DRAFT_1124259 [Paraphysoderma sedebokerense]|nr:hypothetical protein BKA69DRAFT_1124259 [Paraphysoderma sedebokerense]
MVSFVCDSCQETLKKAKLDNHTYRCRNYQFTCIDCNTSFHGTEYRSHTSCISEAEKYQKALYRPKKKGNNQTQAQSQSKQTAAPTPPASPPQSSTTNASEKKESTVDVTSAKKPEEKKEKKLKKEKKDKKDKKRKSEEEVTEANKKQKCEESENGKVSQVQKLVEESLKELAKSADSPLSFADLQKSLAKKVKKSAKKAGMKKEDVLANVEDLVKFTVENGKFVVTTV